MGTRHHGRIADSVAADTNVPVKLAFTLPEPSWPLARVPATPL